jgi:hypothetical protein
MGHNDHMDDRPDLPPEAGKMTRSGFEPDVEWLKTAEPEIRQEAMRTWFLTRYWDPANETPYDGQEGGYIYIHGGPYDAGDELHGRFGGVFEDDEIQAAIDDVESDGLQEWAPIHTEPDYDAEFEFEANRRSDPYQFFAQRLTEVDALASADVDLQRRPLLRQLLYTSLIAALEAYLADTVSYWVAVDKRVFRQFVENCEEFKGQKLTLSQIFERMDSLANDVEKYLQQVVWHRLDKVVPLLCDSFAIPRPSIGELMKHIVVRHDIVHRGGKTRDGNGVIVTTETLTQLRADVVAFIEELEAHLKKTFPEPGSAGLGQIDDF